MPKSIRRKPRTVSALINRSRTKNVANLSTEAQTLFGLLTLIVDIKYRNRYGEVLTDQRGKGYSVGEVPHR
jgi:hypothetical protein